MNILFSEFCGLGNSVLLSSAFRTLKFYKKIKLFYVGNDKFSGLSIHKYNKYVDEIIDISKLNLKCLSRFNQIVIRSDIIIIPEHSNPTLFFLVISALYKRKKIVTSHNFTNRLNFFKKIIFTFLTFINQIKVIKINFPENIHEIEINMRFIENLIDNKNIPQDNIFNNYFDHPGDSSCLNKFNLKKNYFVLQPFCANGLNNYGKFSKSWPVKNFQKLTEFLLSNYRDHSVVFVGDKGDGKNILEHSNSDRIINLISQTSISELISILKNSNFIICHDSSILHLSDSMKLKNLSLFGPTKFTKNRPHNSKSFFIKKKTMEEISIDEVTEVIKKNIYT